MAGRDRRRSCRRSGIGRTVNAVAHATPFALVLVLVALAARAITFGNPILHADEEFYFSTAHAMWRGAVPYVDVWDRKPIGLFLLYLPAAALPWPWGIVRLSGDGAGLRRRDRRADRRAGAARGVGARRGTGGIAYILWIDLAEGQGGQAPVFFNLLVIAAATLAVGPGSARARGGWCPRCCSSGWRCR